ncbi:DUF551 domain-containing protein [Escherichia coli]|nr:DUF551 domain-containing protein [Salmonella enterica subsp. enterica serovar Virchow]EED5424501.1 DUF551 domain-containing protein [Salmonella enterica subsp. enterica]EIF9138382.1 DUF551 domain-containing protein [Escherichia coli]
MNAITKEQLIEDLKASTQNSSGMFEIGEDTICNLMSMLTAHPAPVAPDEMTPQQASRSYGGEVRGYRDGWNACRAAMLQGKSEQPQNAQQNIPENIPGGNSPGIPDGWISCSERMPNDKQYVWCWGKSYGWTEYDTFEGYYDWSRNKWWAVTDDGEEPASKVTHWMPLPEPPQEVNRG